MPPTNEQPQSRRRRATRAERDRRIQQCRALLARGATKSDTKRLFKKSYGLAHRQTERYLRLAREQNREILSKTADEHLADSLHDWKQMRSIADEQIVAARKRMAAADQRLQSADAVLNSENADEYSREQAIEEKKICHTIIDAARRELYSCRRTIMAIRREMDRLLGNHAPIKHAEVMKDGKDVRRPIDDGEPVDAAEEERQILEMYESLKSRTGAAMKTDSQGCDARRMNANAGQH